MLNNFKVAFLFIGAIIGAGFATGREIALYFAESNPATIFATAMLIGVFCGFFMLYGRVSTLATNKFMAAAFKLLDLAVIVSVYFTYTAMLTGAETLFFDCLSVNNSGLITGLCCAVLSVFSMKSVKNINLIIVPLLIIMTVLLFSKTADIHFPTKFTPAKSISYTAMNLLLGGVLIKEQGKTMSTKNIISTSSLTALFVGILLFMMYCVALKYPNNQMPVFKFAKSVKMQYAAAIIIFFAIFSTMLSCAKLIEQGIFSITHRHWCGAVTIALLSVCCYRIDFKSFVDATYPPIGVLGIVYVVICLVDYLAIFAGKKIALKKPPK